MDHKLVLSGSNRVFHPSTRANLFGDRKRQRFLTTDSNVRTFTEASSESASMTMMVDRREGSSSSRSMRVALQKMPRSFAAPLLRTGCTGRRQRHSCEMGRRGERRKRGRRASG